MELILFVLLTISGCGGLRIPANAAIDGPTFGVPRLPPVWRPYIQSKSEDFQWHLENSPKDLQCGLHSKASLTSPLRQTANDKSQQQVNTINSTTLWALRKVPEKVWHVRNITGKTHNISEATPESLRNILHLFNETDHQEQSDDCLANCPNDEEFLPCQCDPCSKFINCSAITSIFQLQQLFHNVSFPIKSYQTFYMSQTRVSANINQTVLLDNLFGNISFVKFVIENTMIEHIMDNAFAGSENTLEEIKLESNLHLTYFPFNKMEHFSELQYLAIMGSSITTVPPLNAVPKLIYVFLSQNKITKIMPHAFADLTALQVIDIGYNMLENIEAKSFQFIADGVLVFLDDNNIQFIDEETFSGKQPGHLDISTNCLNALDERVFKPILDNIIENNFDSFVEAYDNPLQCNNILWLLQNPDYMNHIFLPELNCL